MDNLQKYLRAISAASTSACWLNVERMGKVYTPETIKSHAELHLMSAEVFAGAGLRDLEAMALADVGRLETLAKDAEAKAAEDGQ